MEKKLELKSLNREKYKISMKKEEEKKKMFVAQSSKALNHNSENDFSFLEES